MCINLLLILLFFFHLLVSLSLQDCNQTCGNFTIPFPFYLNTTLCNSSLSLSPSFQLSCTNSSTLHLKLNHQSYKILDFLENDGLLVDFPDSTSCRQYNDLNSFRFASNEFFAVSVDNIIGLYDCEDSTLCKAACETNDLPDCNGATPEESSGLGCCYPLSDDSVWRLRDGFDVFSRFGCRGFSSWVVSRGSNRGKRGVKLEWGVPRNVSTDVCDDNANVVNATAVVDGIRCSCQDGFAGDGFRHGGGCLKYCFKDGGEAYGEDCYNKKHTDRKLIILTGILAPAFIIVSILSLFCLLRKPVKQATVNTDQPRFRSTISFRKACRTRLFTYQELEEATRGFIDTQKLVQDNKNITVFAGILHDSSHIAVQKIQCENEQDLIEVLTRIEHLSSVSHRNLSRIIGCCIDSGYTPLVVYEYPANGTLEEHLRQSRDQKFGLDWYKRLRIVTETACVLGFLNFDIFPPILHLDVRSSHILLDEEFSVKLGGFGFLTSSSNILDKSRNDVYDFAVLLLEIVTGSRTSDLPTTALQKIKTGNLEEVVDPSLYYHEQPPFRREQIDIVADIATRCLLFGGDGKMGMNDVAKELVHVMKQSIDGGSKRGPALDETFSNSSLLQMISMSPDSIYVP